MAEIQAHDDHGDTQGISSFPFRTTCSGAQYSSDTAELHAVVDVITTDVQLPVLLQQAYEDEMRFTCSTTGTGDEVDVTSRPSSPLPSGDEEYPNMEISNAPTEDSLAHVTGLERRKLKLKLQRSAGRITDARSRPIGNMSRKASTAAIHKRAKKIFGRFDVNTLKRCERGSWVGARSTGAKTSPWRVDELLADGFRLYAWTGAPTVITDANDHICAILAGSPNASDWSDVQAEVVRVMDSVRQDGLSCEAFDEDQLNHRRGDFTALSCGVSYGGGGQKPGNLNQRNKTCRGLIQRLRSNRSVRRVAGFQSASFGIFAPKMYKHFSEVLTEVFERNDGLEENFDNSVFPASTFNCGPSTICRDHKDSLNLSYGLCAVTSFGNYNPKKGGHMIFFELKLIVEFPPGNTIHLLSGAITHGNTPISPGETRYSMAQYAAGGLFRWAAYGHKPVKGIPETVRRKIDGADGERWTAGIEMLSKSSELVDDYNNVFPKSA